MAKDFLMVFDFLPKCFLKGELLIEDRNDGRKIQKMREPESPSEDQKERDDIASIFVLLLFTSFSTNPLDL